MKNRIHIRTSLKLNLGFVLAIVGLIAIGIVLQTSMHNIKTSTSRRAQARQTAYRIKQLAVLLNQAETGQRGYLLTDRSEFLEPYLKAKELLPREYSDIKKLLANQPDQLIRLHELQTLIDQKFSEMGNTVTLQRNKDHNAAIAAVRSGRGQVIMEKIRVLVSHMDYVQQSQVEAYNSEMEEILSESSVLVGLGSVGAILVLGISLVVANRNQKRRFEAEQILMTTNLELEKQRSTLSLVVATQNKIATAELHRKSIMDIVVKQTMKITGADGSIIEILDGDDLVYHHVHGAASPFLGMRIPIKSSFSGLCLQENTMLVCQDSETDSRVNVEACRKVNLRSMVVVPLYHGKKVVGVLKNYSSKVNFFNEQKCIPLELVTATLSSALGQAAAFEEKAQTVENLEKLQIELIAARDVAESADKAKSKFLANMSHELRTPLNGIIGLTTLMMDTTLTQEQKDYLRMITESGESLLRIINDILDFSKIAAGRLDFEKVDFDIVSTLQDLKKTFTLSNQKKQVSLELTTDPNIPAYVNGDPGRFRQILTNLISNALKFTQEGSVKVRAKCLSSTDKAVRLRFEVEDTGIGLSSEVIQSLFQEFTQADASTTRKFGGTGLGLSISKRLVEMMSGQIGVDSTPGKGSTFWFNIELAPGRAQEIRKMATATNHPTWQGKHWRILIAEDNPVNQTIAVKMLQKLGLQSDVANNGQEALELLKAQHYDLILMDCQMPELDGYEATAKIRQSETTQGTSRLPIIAMTANAMADDERRCLNAGMDDYIPKPISFAKLSTVLSKWLTHIEQQHKKSA